VDVVTVNEVSNDQTAFISRSSSTDTEDGGETLFRNVGKCNPKQYGGTYQKPWLFN